MRQVGWATRIGAIAIIAVFGGAVAVMPAAACTVDSGCDGALSALRQSQQLKAEAEATEAAEAGAPLSLQTRKASSRQTPKAARQATPATSRSAAARKPPAKSTVKSTAKNAVIPDAPQAVKDANAQAHDADFTQAAAPGETKTPAIPFVETDEINEIDAAAAAPEIARDTAGESRASEPPPAKITDKITDKIADSGTSQPYLAMARVDASEQEAQSVSNSDSAWANTSTIGKIFIALGGFLTAASAIRMFVG